MRPSCENTDFASVSVKAKGQDMCLADFIAELVSWLETYDRMDRLARKIGKEKGNG
jgi:hypothetical protein